MDIPTYRGQSILISAVALGRAFGLTYDDMINGAMKKFNHRIGRGNGPRARHGTHCVTRKNCKPTSWPRGMITTTRVRS